MDRCTTNIAKSQLGFIDFIIKPAYETIQLYLPDIYRSIEGIEENRKIWEQKIPEYEKLREIECKNNLHNEETSESDKEEKEKN